MTTSSLPSRTEMFIFRDLGLARSFAARGRKLWIVLGDADELGGEYLVVTPRQAALLERAGYEILPR